MLSVVCPSTPVEVCNDTIDNDGDGDIDCDDANCLGDAACQTEACGNAFDDDAETALAARAKETVAEVVKRAEGIAAPAAADFFDATYAELPADVIRQRETMRTSSLGQNPGELPGGAAGTQCRWV